MIVVDASVLLAAHDFDDPRNLAATSVIEGPEPLATIDLCAWEAAGVAVRRWRDPAAARRLALRVWLIEESGGLTRVDRDLLIAATSLAEEHGITVYDAAYVATARRLDAPLVSCDVRDLVSKGLARLPG